MARDRIQNTASTDFKLRLIAKRNNDPRNYDLPQVSEIAALIVGDLDANYEQRDIVVVCKDGQFKRISELHPSYLALQYPLLFPFGEDGYMEKISFSDLKNLESEKRTKISLREFIAYRLHQRSSETSHILSSRRLFQQFIVDAFTMIEAFRLNFIRFNQKTLRCDSYKAITDAYFRGESNPATRGKRIVLPSTFTGSARYLLQNYQDAMAICKYAGYPNLFITFTCNPKWPEILREVQSHGLNIEDRPDVVCRVFKMKLDELMKDLRQNSIFGQVTAAIYTIEFQKRGLPHAHILLFISGKDKSITPEQIDEIISAEIPDQEVEEEYYNNVCEFMIHGPCGKDRRNSPCMVDGLCSKHFPKKFNENTTVDQEGFPVYRRRNNKRTVLKNGIHLDNRYVVPHNKYLLQKYGGHINVEWCNQSRSVKYLFKYISKGNDRVTATFSRSAEDERQGKMVDEILLYYDCRYISPCEAVWRIWCFDINFRDPPVERLSFHLPGEQNIFFSDKDVLADVVQRPTLGVSMFTEWFEANKIYPQAKKLTYAEFPQEFVWKSKPRKWFPRKKGFSIGRLCFIAPGSGEAYYERLILNVQRGPECFDDLKTVEYCFTCRN